MGLRKEEVVEIDKTEYIGDGVYATFDGYGIILDLRGQDDTTRICLEPEVWISLQRFAGDWNKTKDE